MTNGQHDSAWWNVFNRQIPNATEYLRQILIEQKFQKHVEILKVARENLDILGITKEEWAEDFKDIMKQANYNYKSWEES
jgi:hypothetical protein